MDEKKHEIKQNKAIEKALEKLMDEVIHHLLVTGTKLNKPLPSHKRILKNNQFYNYYFIGTTLHVFINYIPLLQDKLYFKFPDVCEIIEKAKQIYPDFDSSIIYDVIYNFKHQHINNILEISAENSILRFRNCSFGDELYINSASEVEFENCNLRYTKNIHIYSNIVNLTDCRIGDIKIEKDSKIFLRGVDANINEVIMDVGNDIEIHTSLLCIKNSNLTSQKILLDSDMIEAVNSNIMANNTITIYDDYNDDIKGVAAPIVMYNGVDISNSDGLHIHKEKDKLLEVLKNAKTLLEEIIEKDKTEIIKNYEERVNDTPVKEIINRQNI